MRSAFLFLLTTMISSIGYTAMAADNPPSLAKRPIEGTWNVMPSAPIAEPPGPLPADLAGRLARWDSDARAADAAFEATRPATERLVGAASSAPIASEAWVMGQQALSRLIAARAPLTGALADIDRLYIERQVDIAIDGLPAIYALRNRLLDQVAAQDQILDRLQSQMRSN